MKKIATIALFNLVLFSQVATADEWGIDLTSFVKADPNVTRIAEICGTVTGPADKLHEAKVVVQSDYSGDALANAKYPVNVSPDGRFCTVIYTRYGQVKADLYVEDQLYPGIKAHGFFSQAASKR